MRSVRVFKVGIDRNGNPNIRVVVSATAEEQLALRDCGGRGTDLYGTLFGLPREAAAKLLARDILLCETLTVSISSAEYTKDGETKQGTDVTFNVSGNVSRNAAPVATCDW